MSLRRHAAVLALSILGTATPGLHVRAQTPVLTRSYDYARTGANTQETVLTPQAVGANRLVKRFSLNFNDDPRLEAQPLYVPGVTMNDGNFSKFCPPVIADGEVFVPTYNGRVDVYELIKQPPAKATPVNAG